jgi:Transposase DDE domain
VQQVINQRAQLLGRVKGGVRLDPIKHLPDRSYLAKLYRNAEDRKHDRNGIIVRVLRYQLKEPRRVGCGQIHRLITTLLDSKLDPAKTLIELYHARWEEEIAIDELKTHQSNQPSFSGPMIRSQTPAGVVQELYGLLLDHFIIRKLMFDAAAEAKVAPLRMSFTATLKILRCRIPTCPKSNRGRAVWYEALIDEITEEVLPPRRNRINPRVVKRKMSRWKKKRPEHRNYPQPKHPFVKSIVMLH